MTIKKVSANVERHADRVDNVFVEAQKSFEAFNTFADKLESLKADIKELGTKIDKVDVSNKACVKKKDFDVKLDKIERFDKKVKKVLDDVETYYKKLDTKFKFDLPLEDPSFRWLQWDWGEFSYVEFKVPAIGESIELYGPF